MLDGNTSRGADAGGTASTRPHPGSTGDRHPDDPAHLLAARCRLGTAGPLTSRGSGEVASRAQPAYDTAGRPAEPHEEDATLLAALAEDGRTSQAALADRTGWTTGRVARRLEVLEHSGSLFYDVDLALEKLGYPFGATLWMNTSPAHLHETGSAVAALPQVVFASATTGAQNLMAIVMCTDAADFYDWLSCRLSTVPGITGYTSSVRLRTLKQAASLVHQGRLIAPPR